MAHPEYDARDGEACRGLCRRNRPLPSSEKMITTAALRSDRGRFLGLVEQVEYGGRDGIHGEARGSLHRRRWSMAVRARVWNWGKIRERGRTRCWCSSRSFYRAPRRASSHRRTRKSCHRRVEAEHGFVLSPTREERMRTTLLSRSFDERVWWAGVWAVVLGCAAGCCWAGMAREVSLPFFLIFFSVFISPFVYFLF